MDKLNALADALREAAMRDPVVAEARRRHLRRQQERGRQDAGPVFDEMSKSVEATIAHVRDEAPSVRKAAMALLMSRWDPSPLADDVCEETALSDPVDEVRLQAIYAISVMRNRAHGEKVSSTFARFALDDRIPLGVRRKLYFDLRNSFGTPEMKSDCARSWRSAEWERAPIDPAVVQTCVEMDRLTGGGARQPAEPHKLDAARLHREGKDLLRDHRFSEAEERFTAAICAWRTAGPLAMRARAREAMGRADDAILDLSAAIALMPHLPHLYRQRGETYQRAGMGELANDDFATAESLERATARERE